MTILERKIEPFIKSAEAALSTRNYYAALALCLTLPDICAKLEKTSHKGKNKETDKQKYESFYNEFILEKYQGRIGPDRTLHTFLSGIDCYKLRCAFLHQGEDDTKGDVVKKVVFIIPPISGNVIHNNGGKVLQLQIDIFCMDILAGVIKWTRKYCNDETINERAASLMDFIDLEGSSSIRF